MTVKSIINNYLEKNYFDGLYDDTGECACKKDDLIPCGDYCGDCTPGYIHLGDDDYDFYIRSERESIDSVKEKY